MEKQHIPTNGIIAQRQTPKHDPRIRQMDTYTNGKRKNVRMSYEMARKNGSYMNAVRQAVAKNDPGILDTWKGETITDVNGNIIPLDTDIKKLKTFNKRYAVSHTPSEF